MIFHWSLSDSKYPQVSGTLLCILADLNHAIVWMFSSCPVISKSSRPCTNPLVTVPRVLVINDITVSFMFHNFFNSQARSKYFYFFFAFFQLYSVVSRDSKVHNLFGKFSFFFLFFLVLIITRSGRLAEIRWSVCISKFHKSLCISFSRIDSELWIYHLFEWSNFNFLHNSKWINKLTKSRLVLYSFGANFLHSLIMWLIVSSLSPHKLHLLFCCVLSIIALIWLVLMALFWVAIRRDSVSLSKFSFLSHVTCLSLKMSIQLFFFPFLLF